jgi:hypothetical protein
MKEPAEVPNPPTRDDPNINPKETIVIVIDNKKYRAPAAVLTGGELRKLADPDIGAGFDLWQEIPGGEDNLVEGTERIKLRNGMSFYSANSTINPG